MTNMTRPVKMVLMIGLLIANSSFLLAQESARTRVEQSLTDTQWRLSSFGVSGSESPVLPGTSVTLRFGADGRASGSSGCNSYGAEYLVRGDSISFSKIFSTKRACLEQTANQQEQIYLGALESARQFRISNDSLRIFYRDGRSALNFVGNPPAAAATPPPENQCGPVTLLAAFYDAVNAKEYERAYRFWETPPGSLADFTLGYVNTTSVQLFVQPPRHISGAAGSIYTEIPTMLVSRKLGVEQIFVGCYTTRKSNLNAADTKKDEGWRLYKARMSPVSAKAKISKLLAEACRN